MDKTSRCTLPYKPDAKILRLGIDYEVETQLVERLLYRGSRGGACDGHRLARKFNAHLLYAREFAHYALCTGTAVVAMQAHDLIYGDLRSRS